MSSFSAASGLRQRSVNNNNNNNGSVLSGSTPSQFSFHVDPVSSNNNNNAGPTRRASSPSAASPTRRGTHVLNNNSSKGQQQQRRTSAGGGGGGAQQPPLPLRQGERVELEEYRTTAIHLDRRLNQVKEVMDEFFDDRDLQIVNETGDEEVVARQSVAQQLVSSLRRVPLFKENWQRFPPTRQPVVRVQQRKSIMRLFSEIQRRKQDGRLLTFELIMAILAGVNILLMIVADTLSWVHPTIRYPSVTKTISLVAPTSAPTINNNGTSGPVPPPPLGPVYTPAPRGQTMSLEDTLGPATVGVVLIVYYVMLAAQLFFFLVLGVYYYAMLQDRKLAWSKMGGKQILPKSTAYLFWHSRLPIFLFLEIAINATMPFPWYNTLNSPNAKYLQIFMFVRIYLFVRFFHHFSNLYQKRNIIAQSSEILRKSSFRVALADTMKVYFFEHTILTATLVYGALIFVGGFCVFVAERDANSGVSIDDPDGTSGFSSFFNAVYFMVVSIRTIGYGDIKPITVVGRALTILFQTSGVSIEAIIASVVVNRIAKTKEEKIVDEYLKSFAAWCELRVAAAMVIQAFWKTSLRYSFLHGKASAEAMDQLIRALKRRNNYLKILTKNRALAAVKDNDVASVAVQLRQEENAAESDANYKQIIRVFATTGNANVQRKKRGDGSFFGIFNMEANIEDERAQAYTRIPYLRPRNITVASQDLIDRDRHHFSQNIHYVLWNRTIGNKTLQGFQSLRKFTSSKKVVGRYGERRIPIGKGHKWDIRLEALSHFRESRLAFKRSIATSTDHILDAKLQVAYELLVAASKNLRRNVVLLQGLKRAARLEITSMEKLVALSLSGGSAAAKTVAEEPPA